MLQVFLLGQFTTNQCFDPKMRSVDGGLRPVDFRVEGSQPGVSEYESVSPKVCDKEPCAFLLPSMRYQQVTCVSDVSCDIECSVNVLDGPYLLKLFASKPESFHCFIVNEVCSSAAV